MSGSSKVSDENVGIYERKGMTLKYQRHIDYWYNNFPGTTSSRLVFGTGANYVVDGESARRLPRSGVNPFAHVDMD